MSKIMVIAGGDWQIELIKKAKNMGHYVICSNLYEDSPAFKYADVGEVANVLDKETNLKIAMKHKPDAVISDQSDIAVPTVAYLNDRMGLKGIGIDKAELFTDKAIMRQFCKEHDINVPDFKECTKEEDAYEMLDKYGKIIIKPIDSQSSRGVHTVTEKQQLCSCVNDALSYSNRKKVFLAEEYIGGDEFTIDGVVVEGLHYPICISIKEMYESNPNVSRMQTYTYSHEMYDYDLLRKENKRLIETAGLPFGLTHAEYKFYNGKYYLIEAGARGGGSNLSGKIVPFMSEIDNYELLIKQALGQKVNVEVIEKHVLPRNKAVIMRFFDFGEGIVKKVNGLDYLAHHELVIDYQLNVKVGDKVESPRYGRLRPGHFIIGNENYEVLKKVTQEILEKVTVEF